MVIALFVTACGGDDTPEAAPDPDRLCEIDALLDGFDLGLGTPNQRRQNAEEMHALLDEARLVAPDDVRVDVNRRADAVEALIALLEEVDFDLRQVDGARLPPIVETIDAAEIPVEQWVSDNCS